MNNERASRKVLAISPHFPPDSNAGAHRVRLLAPYLERYGWTPTVLTVDPMYYEGKLDPGLASLVPAELRVERSRAIPVKISRRLSVGDLGLRAFASLYSRAAALLSHEQFDALFITIYPSYTALLGPLLKRRFKIPFILDYQDPWVGAWGEHVGGGKEGAVDAKSRISRSIALRLEPIVVREADAITAVSARTAEDVLRRVSTRHPVPFVEIPIGGDRNDFDVARDSNNGNSVFNRSDRFFHLSCIGTLLPLGVETLRAFLSALGSLRDNFPDLYSSLRVHFVGTSNSRIDGNAERVLPFARQLGVDRIVSENPTRIDYLDSLKVQIESSAVLLLGSSEPHYTASKLYPALLSRRPFLAIYHKESSVSRILAKRSDDKIHLVQFGDDDPAGSHVESIVASLVSLLRQSDGSSRSNVEPIDDSLTAQRLAGTLANLLDRVSQSYP